MADNFTIDDIRKIREMTGVGLTDAKKALQNAGSFEGALETMKVKGLKKVSQRQAQTTGAGMVFSYVHDGRIGVLLELACETDFVARNEAFRQLGRDLTLQVAAMDAVCLDEEDFDAADSDLEVAQASLMAQSFVKDPGLSVRDLLRTQSAQLGERIAIVRFVRLVLGDPEKRVVVNRREKG